MSFERTERLKDFPALATPSIGSIIYVGDVDDSFEEVQTTIEEMFNAVSPSLISLAGLAGAANTIPYYSATNVFSATSLTAFGRSLIGQASASTTLTLIGALNKAGDTMTGNLIMGNFRIEALATPVSPTDAVTKQYVDASISNGRPPASAATTADLSGYIYANGAAGVGATLTAGGNGAFSTDGESPILNARILVAFQSSDFQNGMYNLTQIGDGSHPAILTRATDYDTPSQIEPGNQFFVINGTMYGGAQFVQTATIVTIGTSPIVFDTVTNNAFLLKANNLSDVDDVDTARMNLNAISSDQPTINQANLVGTTTNDNAAAGSVGEVIEDIVASGSAVNLPNSTTVAVVEIALDEGDYDVYGNGFTSFTGAGTAASIWLSLTPGGSLPGPSIRNGITNESTINNAGLNAPFFRAKLAAPATVYLNLQASFATGSASGCGGIYARRRR